MINLRLFITVIFLGAITSTNAQFLKKLQKKAENSVERTIEQRVERESSKKTDQMLDSVLDPKKGQKPSKRSKGSKPEIDNSNQLSVQRSKDFEPGPLTIFEDDFSNDNQGDFPAKWDTNGSGEIIVVDGDKWFRLSGKSMYVPLVEKQLPENFTIEFDMYTLGLDRKTSSQAWINLLLHNTPLFERASSYAMVKLSPCQFVKSPGYIEKFVQNKRQFYNQIGKDYREAISGKSRFSIAVNKTRMRVWINDNKLIDVPRLVPDGTNRFKLSVRGLRDNPDKDEVYITNFRIGKAGVDNRSKLITEGRLSTNAIQFKSGSDNLLQESYKTIREIAKVLENNQNINIKIVGHTDDEGSESSNLELSKKRAMAVKNSLVNQYGIAEHRIITSGKGESDPVASNNSDKGKAQNRRVEFIKL